MNTRMLFFLGCAATVLGCTRNDLDRSRLEEVRGLLLTTSEVGYEPWFSTNAGLVRAPLSKVTESNFQALDTIGVFIYTGAMNAGPYHSTNMIYYTKDGTPDGTTSPQWTAATAMGGALNSGTAYNSTAYYPYQKRATNASSVVHSVAADQSAAAVAGSARALERSDFMWAPPVAVANPATAPAAKFTFQHLLTKLVVSVQVPSMIDGVAATKLNSVTIKNLNTTASIDLGSGVLNNLTDKQNIKPRWLSGNGNPGTVSVYEAIVVPQTAASGVVLVEVKCQTASGEKVANYFPAASGLVLGGGKKITLTLTSAADIAITSELDLVTGQAYTDLALKLKVASGTAWTLTAPTGSWISLASAAGGSYGATVMGTGTGVDQTVYVKAAANTGAGAAPRQAVLTLSAKIAGVDRSVTYTAVQNYSVPVVGFPITNVNMETENYQLPAVVGNSNWYIKAVDLPQGVRLSRRNVLWNELTDADTIALHSLSNTGAKEGYMVSGNYYNSGGALYVVANPDNLPLFSMVCNGVTVIFETRLIELPLTPSGTITMTKGVLVANGAHGCRVGSSSGSDAGLVFQFGSLVGWSGGNTLTGDGTGRGTPALEIKVKPINMIGAPTTFPANDLSGVSTLKDYYFNYNITPYNTNAADIGTFDVSVANDAGTGNLRSGRYAALGVGDPCTYYLGAGFRLPFNNEWFDLFDQWPWGEPFPSTNWSSINVSSIGIKLTRTNPDFTMWPVNWRESAEEGKLYPSSQRQWSCNPSSSTGGHFVDSHSLAFSSSARLRSVGAAVRCVFDKTLRATE